LQVSDTKEEFKVSVDVSHFAPQEISVRVKANELVIEGRHEERSDPHGRVERSFVRKYALPKETRAEAVVSHLSRDGVLTVSAPKGNAVGTEGRVVPIQADHTEKNGTKETHKAVKH
jgi:HSP20 family molecular chaperone IbpA